MSRRAPSWLSQEWGDIYTLHLVPPFGIPGVQVSKHYTGGAYNQPLSARLHDHQRGRGARLTQLQREAGGSWILASVERGTRDREAQLKERGASRRCAVCKAQRAYQAGEIGAAQALTCAGWGHATPRERNLLLEVFELDAPPPGLQSMSAPPPEVTGIKLSYPEPAQEIPPDMDALIDELCATWKAEAEKKAEPAGPEQEAEMELEAG